MATDTHMHHHESHQHGDHMDGSAPRETHSTHAMTEHGGHGGHGAHAAAFARLFWVSLVLSIPVVLFSESVQGWLHFSLPSFPGSEWIGPVLGTIVFVYGGRIFLEGGWDELTQRQPGMMLLISLAIVVAFVSSWAATFGWIDMEFWWELALLITIMLLGHWLEMRALGQTRSALDALAELIPDDAERIEHGTPVRVSIAELSPGDLVLVRPGGRVPADGDIAQGTAEIDESMVTGESKPVTRSEGERVIAGTIVAGSALRVRVTATGEDTELAGIQRMVADAQSSRSRAQVLADRFAGWLFYIALVAGIITFAVWTAIGSIDDALERTVTVLVISCPHALGLAIPLVVAITTEVAAKGGALIRDRSALERMRRIDLVLFDKTGTLTRGEHAVTGIRVANGEEEDRIVAEAAAAEAESEHPLARAIVRAAGERKLRVPASQEFVATPGRGVMAKVDGHHIAVGGPALLRSLDLAAPAWAAGEVEGWEAQGASVLWLLRDRRAIGAFALEDVIRPESREAIEDLRRAGVRTGMITGDSQAVADHVARQLGIDDVHAEVQPGDKLDVVREAQKGGARVAFVGDGVNDAPALAQADVGIAIGAGTDVAMQTAGIVLASSDPRAVAGVRSLSTRAYGKMLQNLGWAAGYNAVAIPLAGGILASIGFTLSPAVGAVLMSLSTIIVALNAQLLRTAQVRPDAE